MLFYILVCAFYLAVPTSSNFFNPYPRGFLHNFYGNGAGERLHFTQYIKQGKAAEARELSLVTGITPNITSYAGFFTVNETCDSNLFFWFFPSQNDPTNDPVSVWLQGGPGSTSLFGLFTENGPYNLRLDGELELREYSWNRNSSLIYIDNPVGVGYSYTTNLCYANNQEDVGRDLLEGLEQFFQVFPEFKTNPLYLTGESYAGKYIPAAAYAILKSGSDLNLQGLLIGDGLVDPRNQQVYSDYLYQLGLIDGVARDEMKKLENLAIDAIDRENYRDGANLMNSVLGYASEAMEFGALYNYLFSNGEPEADIDSFVSQQKIRQALHVGNATWNNGGLVYAHLAEDIPKSVKPWLEELMENYRVTLYNGQLDIIVAYPLTVNYVKELQWSGRDEYLSAPRRIWRVNGALAGYSKSAGTFTEILVRNAGHMVPTNQPEWALDLYNRFIFNQPLGRLTSITFLD